MMRRIVFWIALVLCLGWAGGAAAEASLPEAFLDKEARLRTVMPFQPADRYHCMQNPPDFTWPQIAGAVSYDLCVASDETLAQPAYQAAGLPYHYYNFPYTFQPGIYYWAVRYTNAAGETSAWSAPRRFTIDPDAQPFVVPPISQLVERVPASHPRIWFTAETVGSFRAKILSNPQSRKVLEKLIRANAANLAAGEDGLEANPRVETAVADASSLGLKCQVAALCYILQEDEDSARYAAMALDRIASWDYSYLPDGSNGTNYRTQDQAFYDVLLRTSMAYDWMYPYLEAKAPETLARVRAMLLGRLGVLEGQNLLGQLRREPYNSHNWSYLGYYGAACLVLMGDGDAAYDISGRFGEMLALYLASLPPMSSEDGGWSKGTAYWIYAFTRDKWFMDILKQGGYVDCYQKAWARNEALWALYMMPYGSYGSFGDEADQGRADPLVMAMGLSKLGQDGNAPQALWLKNQYGSVTGQPVTASTFDALLFAGTDAMPVQEPTDYPNAWLFRDQGMAALHSSLTDPQRISLYFRSGRYGAYNHMHADQNSFILEAFGARLAIHSGYYNYHDSHDAHFTRKTFAHNAVTYQGGMGQAEDWDDPGPNRPVTDDMDANGRITSFVTGPDFDAVTGDAAAAYGPEITQARRSVIYLRPQIFIVIDRLAAAQAVRYEWGLNAPGGTMTQTGRQEVRIRNGSAVLETELLFPSATAVMKQDFSDLNGTVYPPDPVKFPNAQPQDRVYFQTEARQETVMAAALRVHRQQSQPPTVTRRAVAGGYALGSGGVTVLVNTGAQDALVSDGPVSFRGTAAVYKDDSVMLIDGVELNWRGKRVFRSQTPVTARLGQGTLSLSAETQDFAVTVARQWGDCQIAPESVTDQQGRTLNPLLGVTAAEAGDGVTFQAQQGSYLLRLRRDAAVNPKELAPTHIQARRLEGDTYAIDWEASPKAEGTQLRINGVEVGEADAPYLYESGGVPFTFALRGRQGSLYSPYTPETAVGPEDVSRFTGIALTVVDGAGRPLAGLEQGGYVTAAVGRHTCGPDAQNLLLAQYDSQGTLLDLTIQPLDGQTPETLFRTSATPLRPGTACVKAFLWSEAGQQPLIQAAALPRAQEPALAEIRLDGEALAGFSPGQTDYAGIPLPEDGYAPVVQGVPQDGSGKVTVRYFPETGDLWEGAELVVQTPEGAQGRYTLRFAQPGRRPVEFANLVDGLGFAEYCEKIGVNPADYQIPEDAGTLRLRYGLYPFRVQGRLCGANTQRIVTAVDPNLELEELLFLAPDSAVYQQVNSPAWAVAAFMGLPYLDAQGKMLDFGAYPVPWFALTVHRDCQVLVLSQDPMETFRAQDGWTALRLERAPFQAERSQGGAVAAVSPFLYLYSKDCRVEDTRGGLRVDLYNQGGSAGSDVPYLTLIRFGTGGNGR